MSYDDHVKVKVTKTRGDSSTSWSVEGHKNAVADVVKSIYNKGPGPQGAPQHKPGRPVPRPAAPPARPAPQTETSKSNAQKAIEYPDRKAVEWHKPQGH